MQFPLQMDQMEVIKNGKSLLSQQSAVWRIVLQLEVLGATVKFMDFLLLLMEQKLKIELCKLFGLFSDLLSVCFSAYYLHVSFKQLKGLSLFLTPDEQTLLMF